MALKSPSKSLLTLMILPFLLVNLQLWSSFLMNMKNFTISRLNAEKTELLGCLKNEVMPVSVRVTYLDKEIVIHAVNDIKICGNHVSKNHDLAYSKNVSSRKASLEKILNSWKRRNLTINEKMIITKCFALSQITFISQFCNISSKDIKRIECICYRFIHYLETVNRSTLKLSKSEGGVNGVYIECYHAAIKIRQMFKANSRCKKLGLIQWKSKFVDEITETLSVFLCG